MKVKAIVTDGRGSQRIEALTLSEPQGHEVLVKIMAAGICHTDLDSMSWGQAMVMGHEGAGEVLAIGEEVSSLAVGDKVLMNWAIPCGHCFQCENDEKSLCETHSFVTAKKAIDGAARLESTSLDGKALPHSFNLGTMAEATLVREEALVKISSKIPYASAAIIGCGVMTGYGSVINAAKVEKGSSVVVIGCGGVGLNVLQGARIAGAGKIYAIDLSAQRLEMAKKFGATDVFQAEADDKELLKMAAHIKELCQGRGADYAFECTAIPALATAPLAMLRNGGMALQLSGVEERVDIDMQLFEWDKIYLNPLYGKANPQRDFPILIDHYENGRLLLDEMISKTYKPEELNQAFDDMHHGRIAKGVLLFGE
jgi:Zn-dependent alcohol dehydrogenase